MNTALAQGMRELSAAEVLMVSGGDGGESDSWDKYEASRDASYQEAGGPAMFGRVIYGAVIQYFSNIPEANRGEADYMKGQRDGLRSSDIGGNNAGIVNGSYDSRDSAGMGGDPGFW
jgi:hypothetical protein